MLCCSDHKWQRQPSAGADGHEGSEVRDGLRGPRQALPGLLRRLSLPQPVCDHQRLSHTAGNSYISIVRLITDILFKTYSTTCVRLAFDNVQPNILVSKLLCVY